MGFFVSEKVGKKKSKVNVALLQQEGCASCILCKKDKIGASGSNEPLVYFLGGFPVEKEETAFTSIHGKYTRNAFLKHFGQDFLSFCIRYNNCVQCQTNYPLAEQTIECCRKSVVEDIERTKPSIVVGFGDIPLNWVNKSAKNLSLWRGRKFPVKIGNHVCWYYSMLAPDKVLESKKGSYESEQEVIFDLDAKNLSEFMDSYKEPAYIENGYQEGITIFEGNNGDLGHIKEALEYFKTLPYVAVDIETIGLFPYKTGGKMLSISIGTDENVIAYPLEHPKAWKGDYKEILDITKNFLLTSGTKIAQNLKFELSWFNHYFNKSVLFETKWADTLAQAYALDERTSKTEGMLSLNTLCYLNFGFYLKNLTSVDRTDCAKSSLRDLLIYNAMDSKYEYKLFRKLQQEMPSSLDAVYNHLVEIQRTIALTQADGLNIDFEAVELFSKDFVARKKKIEAEIKTLDEIKQYEKVYGEFNPASPKQLVTVFKDFLHIESTKETTKGGYSTDDSVLSALSKKYPLAKKILQYRELTKLDSTYIEPVKNRSVIYMDGKMHPEFNTCLTSTGRLSSENLNVQNFPKRENKEVRNIIVPEKGHWLLACDYGQIEARLIASESADEVFINAIKTGYDIHKEWAIRVAQKYPKSAGFKKYTDMDEKDIKKFRQSIKNQLVFPWFYGASPFSVGKSLGLPEDIAKELYEEFWLMFHGVRKWQFNLKDFYRKNGYVENPIGRRRHGPMSLNEIINSPIQGGASDIVTDAMKRLSKASYDLQKPQYQARINIHDDLTFSIPDESLEEDIEFIAKEMCCIPESFIKLNVPISVEVSVGKSWGELEEVSVFDNNMFQGDK